MSLFDQLVITFLPLIPKPVVKFFSKSYIAGPLLEDAVCVTKILNSQGISATIDILGESSQQKVDALQAVDEYIKLVDTIQQEQLNSGISLKPTQLGILIDPQFCYENVMQILRHAQTANIFVRIDMEDSSVTDKILALFSKLHEDFTNVGIVLQAYLRRSLADVNSLITVHANFRLCKGIYIEPWEIAYKDAEIVNNNFALLIEKALANDCYVGIATHDEKIIWSSLQIIDELGLDKLAYEFQMLLGVKEDLRHLLVNSGHNVRVYVPFGKQWYAYSVRRLKENPKIALYVIQSIFKSLWRKSK